MKTIWIYCRALIITVVFLAIIISIDDQIEWLTISEFARGAWCGIVCLNSVVTVKFRKK